LLSAIDTSQAPQPIKGVRESGTGPGFLGIGERYHPLPWKALTYDTGLGGYVVEVSREQLEAAPSYSRDESPWVTPGYGRSVSDYYGMPYGGGI
jgi:hypothetical protein